MTDTTELALCPFCGGELDLCVNDSGARYVSHPKAECILSRKIFRGHNAVALINTRPATPNESELVEIGAMALKPYEPIYYKAWAMEVVKALRPFLNAGKRVLTMADFPSDGNEEDRWIYDCENGCPSCGGSGHKDDCFPKSDGKRIAELEAALKEIAENGRDDLGWRQSIAKNALKQETSK